MDKMKIWVIVVLAVLLVGAVGYIVFDKWNDALEADKLVVFQEGANYGYEQAASMIYQQAATCQQVPITYDNQTINLIAVECLSQ